MDGMTLVNLTPHPVAIYGNNPVEDGPKEVIPPSGTVTRLATIDLGTQFSDTAVYELVHVYESIRLDRFAHVRIVFRVMMVSFCRFHSNQPLAWYDNSSP